MKKNSRLGNNMNQITTRRLNRRACLASNLHSIPTRNRPTVPSGEALDPGHSWTASSKITLPEPFMREPLPAARILIADDHQLLADGCKRLLKPDFESFGVVTDGRSLMSAAAALNPDIILIDIYMPRLKNWMRANRFMAKCRGSSSSS